MESSIGELLVSGVKLMLIGMGIVYLFLALLVWVIGVTSKLINRYSLVQPQFPSPLAPARVQETEGDDGELVAVITAAIHKYQDVDR
jgi:oxaloacetate decarboxylase gamma subunit